MVSWFFCYNFLSLPFLVLFQTPLAPTLSTRSGRRRRRTSGPLGWWSGSEASRWPWWRSSSSTPSFPWFPTLADRSASLWGSPSSLSGTWSRTVFCSAAKLLNEFISLIRWKSYVNSVSVKDTNPLLAYRSIYTYFDKVSCHSSLDILPYASGKLSWLFRPESVALFPISTNVKLCTFHSIEVTDQSRLCWKSQAYFPSRSFRKISRPPIIAWQAAKLQVVIMRRPLQVCKVMIRRPFLPGWDVLSAQLDSYDVLCVWKAW